MNYTFLTNIYSLTIWIGLFITQCGYSQSNFLPGYLINSKRDTIKGWIDYRNWDRNPEYISFKSSEGDDGKIYSITSVTEFTVANEIYVSAIVDKFSYLNFSGLPEYSPEILLDRDTVFLQTLIRGGKNLLYLKDKNGVEQFYAQTDTSFILLKYKRYLKENNGSNLILENKGYVGMLNLLFRDCSDMQTHSKDLDYDKTDLVKLFQKYFKCTDQSITFEQKKEKVGVQIGALAGIAHTSIEANSSTNFLNDVKLSPSTTFSAGIFFNFILSRTLEKWSIAEELLFTSFETGGHYDSALNPATIELAISYIKINNMVRYTFPVGKFFVFTNLGISFAMGVDGTNIRHDESIFHPPKDRPLMGVKGTELGYLLGAGIGYNAFSLHLRFESSNGFSAFEDLATPTKRFYALLGYQF